MKLIAFCEAQADFLLAKDLIDRVLGEAATWVLDLLESSPEAVRAYLPDPKGREFFVIKELNEYTRARSLRLPHGHFDGKPGAADAVMGRTAFVIARAIAKTEQLDAVVLTRDLDKQPERRIGLEQARAEAALRIVLGCANIMREAWVLAGFEPEDEVEQDRLAAVRQALGFSPVDKAHELTSNDERAKRSPKRVLRELTLGDLDRQERCWRDTRLDTLRDRGEHSGLAEFLDEIKDLLVPLAGAS
jgi:hypothetical protein